MKQNKFREWTKKERKLNVLGWVKDQISKFIIVLIVLLILDLSLKDQMEIRTNLEKFIFHPF